MTTSSTPRFPAVHTVDSTCLSHVAYDRQTRTLYVRFRDSGRAYHYLGVPPGVYAELMAAGSHGAYFNTHVKPHYPAAPA